MKFKNLLFLIPPKPIVYGEEQERDICRRAVSRVSSGSVLLQQGRYITGQDVFARKQVLLAKRQERHHK